MIQISNIKLPPEHTEEDLYRQDPEPWRAFSPGECDDHKEIAGRQKEAEPALSLHRAGKGWYGDRS